MSRVCHCIQLTHSLEWKESLLPSPPRSGGGWSHGLCFGWNTTGSKIRSGSVLGGRGSCDWFGALPLPHSCVTTLTSSSKLIIVVSSHPSNGALSKPLNITWCHTVKPSSSSNPSQSSPKSEDASHFSLLTSSYETSASDGTIGNVSPSHSCQESCSGNASQTWCFHSLGRFFLRGWLREINRLCMLWGIWRRVKYRGSLLLLLTCISYRPSYRWWWFVSISLVAFLILYHISVILTWNHSLLLQTGSRTDTGWLK